MSFWQTTLGCLLVAPFLIFLAWMVSEAVFEFFAATAMVAALYLGLYLLGAFK